MMVAPALQRIHQISIRTQDTPRAVAFYRDMLGLKLLFQAPPALAFFDCGGVRLMLGPAEPEFDHQGSVIYFAVDDINAAHTALAAAGVTVRTEPHLIAKLPTAECGRRISRIRQGTCSGRMRGPK